MICINNKLPKCQKEVTAYPKSPKIVRACAAYRAQHMLLWWKKIMAQPTFVSFQLSKAITRYSTVLDAEGVTKITCSRGSQEISYDRTIETQICMAVV